MPRLRQRLSDVLRRGRDAVHRLQRFLLFADWTEYVRRDVQRGGVREQSQQSMRAVRLGLRHVHLADGLSIVPKRQRRRLFPFGVLVQLYVSLKPIRTPLHFHVHELQRRLRDVLRRGTHELQQLRRLLSRGELLPRLRDYDLQPKLPRRTVRQRHQLQVPPLQRQLPHVRQYFNNVHKLWLLYLRIPALSLQQHLPSNLQRRLLPQPYFS